MPSIQKFVTEKRGFSRFNNSRSEATLPQRKSLSEDTARSTDTRLATLLRRHSNHNDMRQTRTPRLPTANYRY